MIIKTHSELYKSNLKVGDSIWACAYEFTMNSKSMKNIQKPIKGVLTTSRDKKNNDSFIALGETGTDYIRYFVPYKKNEIDLSWSRAVEVYSRKFATTEEEATELYNKLIDEYIAHYTEMIERLK